MEQSQRKNLHRILERNLKNQFDLSFLEKKDWYNYYRKFIPETTYSNYLKDIEYDFQLGISKISKNKTTFFATTSGVDGKYKIIPHSRSSLRNYYNSSLGLFFNLIKKQGVSKVIGKNLLVTGKPTDSYTRHDVPIGSISGMIASKIHQLAPPFFTYSPDKAGALEPKARYKYILDSFNPELISGIIGTNPYIIHKFLSDKISSKGLLNNSLLYNGLDKFYPKVKFIICLNGHPLKWHSEQLLKAFNNSVNVYDPGIGASEGIFTCGGFSSNPIGFPIRSNKSQFIEYKPLNGDSSTANFSIKEFLGDLVEPIITTEYGFKRYLIEDIYKVISYKHKYALEFIGKKEKIYSNASERIHESNIYELIKKYSDITKICITDYVFYFEKISGDLGRYTFVISTNDFRLKEVEKDVFKSADILDKIFQDINPEYRNSRKNNFLLPASIRLDNDFIPKFRTSKIHFNKQEKEQTYIIL